MVPIARTLLIVVLCVVSSVTPVAVQLVTTLGLPVDSACSVAFSVAALGYLASNIRVIPAYAG